MDHMRISGNEPSSVILKPVENLVNSAVPWPKLGCILCTILLEHQDWMFDKLADIQV